MTNKEDNLKFLSQSLKMHQRPFIITSTSGEVLWLNNASKYIFSLKDNDKPNLLFIENLFTLSINEFSQICVLDQSSNVKLLPNLSYDLIVSGGEYGFSEDELNFLLKTKASFVKLSENILRAETAPVVALSIQNL